MAKPTPRRSPSRWQPAPPAHLIPRGKVVLLVVVAMLVAILGTDFFDKVHYNNQLTHLNHEYGVLQDTEAQEHADLKFVVQNYPSSLNCYQLLSPYAQQLCQQHNSTLSNQ
ncbi:MAG TPA: hypothetical protein VHD60_02000 [Candidatus Saccharimonadales bacterium]|nr:hypothetical protein [Candidatus Saccharimonadales bacterium]